jgi:hypothetical protein
MATSPLDLAIPNGEAEWRGNGEANGEANGEGMARQWRGNGEPYSIMENKIIITKRR